MVDVNRVRVTWSGWVGGPGISTFHFLTGSAPPLAALQTFFTAMKTLVPPNITLQVENVGQTINVTSGQAVNTWSGTAQTSMVGTGQAKYHAAAGVQVTWKTGIFAGGREIRGRSFFVPIDSANYDTNGTLVDATRTSVQTAVNTFVSAVTGALVIYSRPPISGTATVSKGTIEDKLVVLTSRRD
jgi:hypothetical protein